MKRGGFTIIEVLTVIMVFSILVGISGYAYSVALKRTRDQQRITDLNNIKSAIELYYLDNKSFPGFNKSNEIALAEYQLAPAVFSNCVNNAKGVWPTYIQNFPRDPKTLLGAATEDCNSLKSKHEGEYVYFVNSYESPRTGYLLAGLMERENNINMISDTGENSNSDYNLVGSWGYTLSTYGLNFCGSLNSFCTQNYKILSGKNE